MKYKSEFIDNKQIITKSNQRGLRYGGCRKMRFCGVTILLPLQGALGLPPVTQGVALG